MSEQLEQPVSIKLRVNGTEYPVAVDEHQNLLGAIRAQVGLTGTKQGCDDCECGACIVLIEDRPVNSCSYLAVQAAGRDITTVEGLATDGELSAVQAAMLEAGGVQCGFCTPGMMLSATALLTANPNPTRDEIKVGLGANLCRCTGYGRIIDAVERASRL